MRDFLTRPFPLFESRKNRFLISTLSSVFIFFFLFLIGPFGLFYNSAGTLLLYSFAYALITFVVLLANFFLLQPWVIKKFNVWKTLLWNIWFLFTIGIVNCFSVALPNGVSPNIKLLLAFQGYTFLTGIFVSGFLYLFFYIFTLRKKLNTQNTDITANYNIQDELINTSALLNGINPESVLYIASADNYIDVYYFEQDTLKHKLFRSTLDCAGQNLTYIKNLVRCHRSFIVNLDFIESAKGNAAGYRLKLRGLSVALPVSRKYTGRFQAMLQTST